MQNQYKEKERLLSFIGTCLLHRTTLASNSHVHITSNQYDSHEIYIRHGTSTQVIEESKTKKYLHLRFEELKYNYAVRTILF